MDLNILDWIALTVLFLSVVTAFVKGFFAELISIGSVLAGLVLAVLFHAEAAAIFQSFGLTAMISEFAGFLGIFLGTLIAGSIINRIIKKLLSALRLRFIDRLLGGVFGLIRGWLVNIAVFLAMATFQIGGSLLEQSQSAEFFLTSAGLVAKATPSEFRQRFEEEYEKIYQIWLEQTREEDASTAEETDN
jgi:membrane protein required for colicin V production